MMQNEMMLRILTTMTMRIAITIFLLSFAVITGWLMNREPAEHVTTAHASTQEAKPKTSSTATHPTEEVTQPDDVIALSDKERSVHNHLKQTIIPLIDMEKVSLEEAIDFFCLRLREIEPTADSTVTGLSFVIRNPRLINAGALDVDTAPIGRPQTTITLSEMDITAKQALNLICAQAGYRWQITEQAIELTPLY